jgi:hypothetical protein
MVDYKLLLWKYIMHVGVEEGVTFISRIRLDETIEAGKAVTPFSFTEEELAELQKLDVLEQMPGSVVAIGK